MWITLLLVANRTDVPFTRVVYVKCFWLWWEGLAKTGQMCNDLG